MVFAKNIRYFRQKNDWSQEDLAKKLGYKSLTTIAKWESGVAEPPIKVVKVLSEMFGVSVSSLVNDDLTANTEVPQGHYIDPEVEELAQELYDRPELKVLFSTTKKVSKEDLQFVQKMVDTMAKEKNGNDDDIC